MIIKKLNELNIELQNEALSFCRKFEIISVQLCSHIKKSSEKAFVVFVNQIDSSCIYGVLLLRNSLLHCLPFSGSKNESKLQENFTDSFADFFNSEGKLFYEKNPAHIPGCINGTASGAELILKAFKKLNAVPRQENRYDLMRLKIKDFIKLPSPEFPEGEKAVISGKKTSSQFFEQLLALQSAYEKEEVLPAFEKFNPENTKIRLTNALKNQTIFTVSNSEGKMISKAASNAIGFRAVQIGGVFTVPEFRNKHYSRTLLYFFLKKLCISKKMPVLFVKKSNKPAQALYESLKFIKITDYSIVYF